MLKFDIFELKFDLSVCIIGRQRAGTITVDIDVIKYQIH